ncbi:MAG: alcohol dehydrogenase catalytic domain-containing protein [Clostridia bacterium]|nr:alcohol dehydrogenase catalytic domain-containing protein [Clostridia bacterium]
MVGKMMVSRFMEPYKMQYQQEDIPQIEDNDILIRVKACGICGSDLVYYNGKSPLDTPDGKGPLILGHEFSGVVAEVGATARKMGLFAPGDRVAVNPVQQCNACPACMRGEFNECSHLEVVGTMVDGAMAEYVKAKYTHVHKIPDEIPFRYAALAEPLACATHAVQRLDVQLGQTVVVYGVGGIGLMMTQLVRAAGAGKVIVVARKDFGLGKARECGATHVINNSDVNSPDYAQDVAARIREINAGRLADRVILATGNMSALQDALNVSAPCSTIVYFGQAGEKDILQVPVLATLKSEKTLKFSWLAPLVWDNVFRLLASGQVNLAPIITHTFSLADAEAGIRFMLESKEPKVKGVILVDPEQ